MTSDKNPKLKKRFDSFFSVFAFFYFQNDLKTRIWPHLPNIIRGCLPFYYKLSIQGTLYASKFRSIYFSNLFALGTFFFFSYFSQLPFCIRIYAAGLRTESVLDIFFALSQFSSLKFVWWKLASPRLRDASNIFVLEPFSTANCSLRYKLEKQGSLSQLCRKNLATWFKTEI